MPNNSKYPFLLLIFVAIAAVFLWSWLNSPLVVTVTGQGEVNMPATTVTLTFSVIGEGGDAAAALGNTKTKSNFLKKVMVDSGIDSSDIVESQITVVPGATLVAGATGYRASISLGGKNIASNKLDMLIPLLYANGAYLVSQPTIDITNQQELEKIAFKQALKDAEKQADSIAKSNAKFFKKAVSIVQSSQPVASVSNKESVGNPNSGGLAKIISVVSVSYKMW